MRRTLRRSMSTGGVPMRPAYRTRRPGRPELVVLCDVSGSVAGFSHFTLLLVQALREQFSRVRVFAFVERADEVTHLFEPGAEPAGVMTRVLREADLVAFDGHSDYGGSFGGFAEHWGDAVGPRSLAAGARGRAHQLPRPEPGGAAPAGRPGPARALAQPGAAPAVGQRRLGGAALRRRAADARVPDRRLSWPRWSRRCSRSDDRSRSNFCSNAVRWRHGSRPHLAAVPARRLRRASSTAASPGCAGTSWPRARGSTTCPGWCRGADAAVRRAAAEHAVARPGGADVRPGAAGAAAHPPLAPRPRARSAAGAARRWLG